MATQETNIIAPRGKVLFQGMLSKTDLHFPHFGLLSLVTMQMAATGGFLTATALTGRVLPGLLGAALAVQPAIWDKLKVL